MIQCPSCGCPELIVEENIYHVVRLRGIAGPVPPSQGARQVEQVAEVSVSDFEWYAITCAACGRRTDALAAQAAWTRAHPQPEEPA